MTDIVSAYRTSDELFARAKFWEGKRKEYGERLLECFALDGKFIAEHGRIPSLYKPKLERFNKAVAMEKACIDTLEKFHKEVLTKLYEVKEQYEDGYCDRYDDDDDDEEVTSGGSWEKAKEDYDMFHAMTKYRAKLLDA